MNERLRALIIGTFFVFFFFLCFLIGMFLLMGNIFQWFFGMGFLILAACPFLLSVDAFVRYVVLTEKRYARDRRPLP